VLNITVRYYRKVLAYRREHPEFEAADGPV